MMLNAELLVTASRVRFGDSGRTVRLRYHSPSSNTRLSYSIHPSEKWIVPAQA